jgi:hypothetical protein
MNRWNNIITECYADTLLLSILGFEKKVEHSLSKSKIGWKLKKYLDAGVKLNTIAVYDEDPEPFKESHPFFKNFIEKHFDNELKIKILNFKDFWIIEICPDLESWILYIAKKNKFNLKEYNIPSNSKELHSLTATTNIPKNIKDFFLILKSTKELLKIKSILSNPEEFIANATQSYN